MSKNRQPPTGGKPGFPEVLEASFEGIGISDKGVIIHVNKRMAEMYRCEMEDLVGAPVTDFVAPEDRERVERLIREGHGDAYTHRALRKDGTTFPVQVRGWSMEWEGKTVRVSAVQDVSEKERTVARIRESEERLRLLFDAAPDAYFVHDLQGRIVETNRAAVALLGLEKEELQGRNITELGLSPTGLLQEVLERLSGDGESEPRRPFEMHFLEKEGSQVIVEMQSTRIRIQGEDLVLTVGRNVTHQRRVSERLSILTKAVESSSEVVFLTDLRGVFLYVNPAFTRMYGWEAGEVVGLKTPRILKSGIYAEDYYTGMWEILSSGEAIEGEVRNRTKSGELVDVAASANPVFNDDGEIIGYLAIQSDISARKRHEETVLTIASGVSGSTGETFFYDLARHLCRAVGADVAILGEVDGINDDHIRTLAVEVDGLAAENFTYPLDGAPCAEALKVGHCVESHGVQKRFPRDLGLKHLGAEAYVGKALTAGSGESLGVALVLFREPLADPTLAVSMLEIFAARAATEMERSRQETQRRKLEEQLRQAQKMEEIGQLTGGIAHDFQNLLSVILLNTEMMRESLESGEVVTLGEVREIEEAAQHAANMTRKLLGFGRRADLSLVVTEMAPVVEGMSAMLRRAIPENIEVSIQVKEGSWKVKADPGAVEQILLNLATNARDAMPGGGSLRISLDEAKLNARDASNLAGAQAGDFLKLTVQDTGVGIDPQVQARVFEPFFTTKPVGEGTGLGLAMAYGLAQQLGGFLELESEVGVGTEVSLYLPLESQFSPQDPAEEAKPEAVGGTETILIVEDQPALRRTLKMVLERAGYSVELAGDGEEGLELARAHGSEIDLVVSDLVMPRMGGLELYRALRKEELRIPVIIASGYAGKSASGLAELDPDVPVLKKPWKPKELLRLIRQVLDRV